MAANDLTAATATEDMHVESAGGRYKLASLRDFRQLRERIADNDGWTEKLNKPWIRVWTKPAPADSDAKGLDVVKVNCFFPNVEPSTMYDALHDPLFRRSWDDKMIEGYNIAQLDARNDIGYYSVKFPFPLASRDFLNQRSWMEFDNGEYIIMNRSVKHSEMPEKKDFVRGISVITGFYLKPMDDGGTELLYMTHSDIKGSIPHMVLNAATQKMAPSMMERLGKNGENYSGWVEENHPAGFKPTWRSPKVNWEADLKKREAPVSLVAGGDDAAAGASSAASAGVSGNVPSEQFVQLQAELDEARATLAQLQHRNTESSLAPVAPRQQSDAKAVQQYRALMQQACGFVDRQFLEEGKVPTLEEYLTRLRSVVDGLRRTM